MFKIIFKRIMKAARRRVRSRPRRMTVDILEKREVLSGITLSDGVLEIIGTPGHDDAQVWVSGDKVYAGLSTNTAPGKPWLDAGQRYHWDVINSFQRTAVKEVQFIGEAGDDWLDSEVPVPTRARGGPGKDTLEVYGNAVNELFGGPGDDQLWGGPNVDYLHGEDGNDLLQGGGGNDHLYGGPGRDIMAGGSGDDTLVSIDGDATDILYGNGGLDSFWIDSEGIFFLATRTDAMRDASEQERRQSLHIVRSFENGADKTLNRDRIDDPTDGQFYKNFSKRPLFAVKGPSERDVKQGVAGDCWLLSSLGATAKANPRAIRDTVVDLGDGTYAVKLGGKFYRVDGDLPTWNHKSWKLRYAKPGQDGSIWVPIVEKAYAFYRMGLNTYGSLNGGDARFAFEALGGNDVAVRGFDSAFQALSYIGKELSKGRAVVVQIHQALLGCPCIPSHMYMVETVKYETRRFRSFTFKVPVSVVLRNPWGADGVKSDGINDGLVTVTGDQLVASMYENSGVVSAWV